jgi:putative transposase
MAAATDLGLRVGLKAACRAFSLNRAFVCRERLRARPTVVHSVRVRVWPLAFCAAEQALLLALLNSKRFADVAPAAVFAILLDEGRYHGSRRTMYRLLAACHLTGERRRQRYIKRSCLRSVPIKSGLGT